MYCVRNCRDLSSLFLISIIIDSLCICDRKTHRVAKLVSVSWRSEPGGREGARELCCPASRARTGCFYSSACHSGLFSHLNLQPCPLCHLAWNILTHAFRTEGGGRKRCVCGGAGLIGWECCLAKVFWQEHARKILET